MNLQEMSPYIRFAGDSIINTPWKLNERVIFDYELLFVKEGEIEVTVEDQRYHGAPGDIFLFRPKIKHSIQTIGNHRFRQPHVHFDLFYQENSPDVKISFKPLEQIPNGETHLFREDAFEHTITDMPDHMRPKNPVLIEKMIFDIIHEYEMKLPYYEVSIKGIFTQLFLQLIRENYWNQNPHLYSNMERLTLVRNYLKHHVTKKIALDELSSVTNISKHHLIRLFKKAFGMSPIQYHQLVRIEKAKEKIKFTESPISSIAEEFGFESIHSFSRAFKKIEGVPPSFYRRAKSMKQGNQE
jgi:AraC-like DNA-binding protein